MKSRISALLGFLFIFTSIFDAHADIQRPSSNQIVCSIWDTDDNTGDDRELALLTITLDKQGIASNLHLVRLLDKSKTSSFLPNNLDLTLDNARDFITHGVRPGRVIDHEGDKPVFDWEANRVEYVKSVSQSGNYINISINDHKYSGHPGSTITYKVDGKQYSEGVSMTSCDGAVKLPMVW